MTTGTSEQRREYLREIGRRGGKARARQASFAEHQSRAGRRCAETQDMAALGHKGARAYIEKYGYGRLWQLARRWRIDHPSSHEQAVMAILDELGLPYAREVELLGEGAFVSVDFVVAGGGVIEVNGKVHYDPFFDHPNYPHTRQANDAERVRRLEKAGYQVLVIDHRELGDGERVRVRIAEFLAQGGFSLTPTLPRWGREQEAPTQPPAKSARDKCPPSDGGGERRE
jgi:very-short-patch-repair endonuclease